MAEPNMPLIYHMYSNENIIQNLKQSLFQDTEKAFDELFGPFIIKNDSFDPSSVNIKKDIEIKKDVPVNFYVKNESKIKNSIDKIEEESESSDSIENVEIEHLIRTHTVQPKKKSNSNILTQSMRMKSKAKSKSKTKSNLKRKVVMV